MEANPRPYVTEPDAFIELKKKMVKQPLKTFCFFFVLSLGALI